MMTCHSVFRDCASRILPAGVNGETYLRFQALAKVNQLAKDTTLGPSLEGPQLFCVAKGAVKLVAHASRSRDQIVAFHFAGDVFTAPMPDNYCYSVGAVSDSYLIGFDTNDFIAAALGEPDILRHLLDTTTLSLRRCREKTIALGRKTAAERVAVFLVGMADRIGTEHAGHTAFDLPMSRRDIAESLGLTIETVSRQFSKLKDEGVIETCGRSGIILHRMSRLQDRAGFLREAA